MSEFVNFNKRNVTLPSGCKDLIDVLVRQNQGTPGRPFDGVIRFGGRPVREVHQRDGLRHVRRYVTDVLEGDSPTSAIEIASPLCSVLLYRDGKALYLIISVEDAAHGKALSAFLARETTGPRLDAGIGEHVHCVCQSLPFDVEDASRLTTALLREVYELTDESKLTFVWFDSSENREGNGPKPADPA